jgi:hypothetical protein
MQAVHCSIKRPGAAKSDDELVDRALGALNRVPASNRVDLCMQVGIEGSDLVPPPVVVGIVLIILRLDHNLKRAVRART